MTRHIYLYRWDKGRFFNKIIPHANIWTKPLLVVMLYDWKLFKNIGYDTGQNFTKFDKYLSVSSPITCQVKMTCINANKNQSYHISLVSILFIFQITSLDFFYTSVWVLVRVRFTLGVYLSAQVTGMPCSYERCGKRESIQVCTVFFFAVGTPLWCLFPFVSIPTIFWRVTCRTVSARSMFMFCTWHRCDFSFPLDEWVYLLHVSYPLSDVLYGIWCLG